MLNGEYLEAKNISERIASEMKPPRFYLDKKKETEASERLLEKHPMVQACLKIVETRADRMGHGLSHVRKVAVDAGALVMIEEEGIVTDENPDRLVMLAHIAGVLHDIKREEPEHAQRGAEEAGRVLKDFDLEETERRAIIQAISNHEAFKPAKPLDNPSLQLLSDALYDADKFRWGPDNFTETLWEMVAPRKIPIAKLLDRFMPGLKGIERIKDTFRTPTGRMYGPDFIDRGLEIGKRLYEELRRVNQKD